MIGANMSADLEVSKESVILLCKGGYLPARSRLTDEQSFSPPSGPLAYHEYYMARRRGKEYFDSRVANPRQPMTAPPDAPTRATCRRILRT